MSHEEHDMVNRVIDRYNTLVVDSCCIRTERDSLRLENESLQKELMKCYQEIAELRSPGLLMADEPQVIATKPLKIAIPKIEFGLGDTLDSVIPKVKTRKKKNA